MWCAQQWNIWCFKSAARYMKCESAYTCIMIKRLWAAGLVGFFLWRLCANYKPSLIGLACFIMKDSVALRILLSFLQGKYLKLLSALLLQHACTACKKRGTQEGKSDLIRALVLRLWLFCDFFCPKRLFSLKRMTAYSCYA